MRLLRDEALRASLSMVEAIDALETVYEHVRAGQAEAAPRLSVPLPTGWVRLMAAHDEVVGYSAVKVFNLARGAGVRYAVMLYRLSDGELRAMLDGRLITDLRTGGMSGLVARHLPKKAGTRVAVIGSGHQARMQLEALAAVMALGPVTVFSPTRRNREAFAEDMGPQLGVRVATADSAPAALEGAEVVVVATSARDGEPVVRGRWLEPDALIFAVGSTRAESVELDAEAFEQAQWVLVDTVHACEEAGDISGAIRAGAVDADAVVSLESRPPIAQADWTAGHLIFKSVGSAVQDLALAHLAVDHGAADHGDETAALLSLKQPVAGR